jgi:hypothetical protein
MKTENFVVDGELYPMATWEHSSSSAKLLQSMRVAAGVASVVRQWENRDGALHAKA